MQSEGTERADASTEETGLQRPVERPATSSPAARAAIALHALLLAGCAVVQWNDPDPLPWMLLYGAIAVVAVFDLRGYPQRGAAALLTLLALSWMLSLTPEALTVDALLPSEVGREWMGLAFAACSAGLLAVRAHRSSPSH